MPGSLAEGVSPAAMLVGDRGPRRWESWTVGRSDWWWVCTDEGRLRCATLSLLSWLSVLVGFGRGPERLKNFTRGDDLFRLLRPGRWFGSFESGER